MAYNASTGQWIPEDDSVSAKLTGLLSKSNPLMKQAETVGLQQANRRGMLNSSIATGAATNEMIKAALPVASQESSQIHAKNLTAQQLAGQKELAGLDITSREKIATQNVAAHDRQYSAAALSEAQKTYGALFTEIQNNKDLTAETRDKYYQHASALRDTSLNLIEQLYGIDLDWTSAVATT